MVYKQTIMKRVLYVRHKSCNEKYLSLVLNKMIGLIDLSVVDLEHYAVRGKNYQNDFDVIIYHTFPHQNHPNKWNTNLIECTDNLFFDFKGHKILFDSHDSGNVDAFSRFKNKNIPRIKAWPSYKMISEYNIIQTVAGGAGRLHTAEDNFLDELSDDNFNLWKSNWPNDKDMSISYIVSYGYHNTSYMDYPTYISKSEDNKFIRENTRDCLQNYKRIKTDMVMKSQVDFHNHLKTSLVSVSVPGWGEGCLRQYEAPLYGCLNLLHESISEIKLLPHVDLIDGEDFISFNIENLHEKLNYIFDNLDIINTIRYNGKKKLHVGYNHQKSANQLVSYINGL